jgi:hypothetical protein
MSTSRRFVSAVVAVVGLLGIGTGTAVAETANGGTVPLSMTLRACDFSVKQFVGTNGTGSGQATIGTGGGNTVNANITFAIGRPNTAYKVRLIQGPRPASQTCVPGDPGVVGAVLVTDGNGTGSVSLHDTVRQGATNAWVFMEGPTDWDGDIGQIRGEFYTTQNLISLQ